MQISAGCSVATDGILLAAAAAADGILIAAADGSESYILLLLLYVDPRLLSHLQQHLHPRHEVCQLRKGAASDQR